MNRPPSHADARLDAYLDGLLEGEDKLDFERELAEQPELRQAVEHQRAIDESLARAMRVPESHDLRAIVESAGRTQTHPASSDGWTIREFLSRPLPIGRTLGVAAAIALLVTGAVVVWNGTRPARPISNRYGPQPWRSMGDIYRAEVDRGFRPRVVCADDAEFSRWFEDRFGQGLALAPLPDGHRALGLTYANTITPRTICVLAEADGAKVVLFVDRAEKDTATKQPPNDGLVLHHAAVGLLTVYELSPLPAPRLLPYLRARPTAGGKTDDAGAAAREAGEAGEAGEAEETGE